jgi:hypothetical protein
MPPRSLASKDDFFKCNLRKQLNRQTKLQLQFLIHCYGRAGMEKVFGSKKPFSVKINCKVKKINIMQ